MALSSESMREMLAALEASLESKIKANVTEIKDSMTKQLDGLQASVRNVATTENQALNSRGSMGKILNEVENVRIVSV